MRKAEDRSNGYDRQSCGLVTDGASGKGLAIADRLLMDGVAVVVAGIDDRVGGEGAAELLASPAGSLITGL